MELTKTDNGKWKPGQSGNISGRPVGARQNFSAGFLRDLAEVWAAHGKDTMLHTAKLNPEVFFATCARLIPKDVQLTVQQNYSFQLDPVDLEILRAIKEAVVDAGQREPGAVLQFVLDAIRSHNAQLIEVPTDSSDTKE
jgi:hypothetical protein